MAGAIPIGGDVHFDVPLSTFASEAFAVPGEDDGLIGDQLLPAIPVGRQSDKYYVIEKDAFWRVPNTLRAPRTAAKRVQFTTSSDAYFCPNYALAGENALEDLANADNAIALRQNSVRLVLANLRLDQEVRIANLVTSISNVGSGVVLTGANKWSDAGSDPVADVTTGHSFVRQRTGLVPNTMVIDWDTLQIVRRHPMLLDLYKYTSGGEVNDTQLMQTFKVSRMLVARAVRENMPEGATTSSVTNVWGNTALLCHVGQATGLQSRTFAARFRWRNPIWPGDFGVQTAVEGGAGQRKVEVVETGYFQDEKVIGADLGYVISGTL